MARFFFDLVEDETTVRDENGTELLDVRTACERARILAYTTIEQGGPPVRPFDTRELHVRAETGERVAKVAFRYVTA